jgi:hypothetical protein
MTRAKLKNRPTSEEYLISQKWNEKKGKFKRNTIRQHNKVGIKTKYYDQKNERISTEYRKGYFELNN